MSNKSEHYSEHIHPAFSGFRRENLLSCFAALCESPSITRADLASATELSIMTIGKIADALIENAILTEQKLPIHSAGRRPGSLSFLDTPLFLILNVSTRRFSAHLIAPCMKSKELCAHDYNDIFPFDDNLLIFLNAVRRACNVSSESIPYLAVITAPDDDKRQSITRTLAISPRSKQHMLDYITKILRREYDLVLDEITAAQLYFNSLSAYKNIGCGAYLCLSDMTYAAVWMRGNLLAPRICRIGDLIMQDCKRVADVLADALCNEDAILPVAYALSTLETFFTPDCIVLESGRFRMDDAFLEDVYTELARILPAQNRILPIELSCSIPSIAVNGCAGELRRKWFYDLTGLT